MGKIIFKKEDGEHEGKPTGIRCNTNACLYWEHGLCTARNKFGEMLGDKCKAIS